MTKKDLTKSVAKDLTKLAVERSCAGVESVTQLVDDDKLKFVIQVSVAGNLICEASNLLIANQKNPDGSAMTRDGAIAVIFMEIADAFGFDWRKKTKQKSK